MATAFVVAASFFCLAAFLALWRVMDRLDRLERAVAEWQSREGES